MHVALWQLMWLDLRGTFRRLSNVRSSWRQLVLLLFMLLFAGLFIISQRFGGGAVASTRFGSGMPFWSLIYLLATWLTASADRGLVMRPAEIHFVAGGPFPARDVITLNLCRLAYRSFISAAVLALIASAYVASFLSALVGIWMLVGVSLLVGMVASLSARKSHSGLVKAMRKLMTLAGVAILMLLIVQSMRAVRAGGDAPQMSTIAAAAAETQVGKLVLPPLDWMFQPIAAARFFPDTLKLLPARIAILCLFVLAIYLLGGDYLEASTSRTDRSIAKRQSALRSGAIVGAGWMSRVSLPAFPYWGGIGGVAWMQTLHSLRILPRFLLFTAVIVGAILVVPLLVDRERLAGLNAIGWMAGLTAYADFLLLLQLPVGFLGPVAQREMLKSLPIAPWRVALGQLAGPILPVASLHVLVTALFLFLVPDNRLLVLQAALALIPAAIVVIANINLLGSWNVIQPRALQQRDALAAGRAMVSVWIFFAMLLPAIVMAGLVAVLAGAWLGRTPAVYMAGAASGALLSSGLYIYLLARSFEKWQPSAAEGGSEEIELDR